MVTLPFFSNVKKFLQAWFQIWIRVDVIARPFDLQAKALKISQPQDAAGGAGVSVASPKGKLPPVEGKTSQQTEEILNSILPPR